MPVLETKLYQRLTGNGDLLAFLRSGKGRATRRTGEDSDTGAFASACEAANQPAQPGSADNVSGCVLAFSAALDLISTGHKGVRRAADHDIG